MFKENFEQGFIHLYTPEGYAHVLFLLALWAAFTLKDWPKLLVMLTAFTLGHAMALILLSRHFDSLSAYWIALFIPATIFLASIQNLIRLKDKSQNRLSLYPLAMSFALINGLNFSHFYSDYNFAEPAIRMPQIAFNAGVEISQILLLAGFLYFGNVLSRVTKVSHKVIVLTVSILTAVLSGYMIWMRL